MPRVTPQEVQSWLEGTKSDLAGSLDSDFLRQIEARVLGQIASAYPVSAWVSVGTTPELVRVCIAMKYAAWFYRRTYSEEGETNQYATLLDTSANALITGIINGSIILPDATSATTVAGPSFYPSDASSALDPINFPDDRSVGPGAFSMNKIF
jgi:hypothetical protein